MILQAYIDDSTDDVSGNYVLAGYIASIEQWAAFSREWEGLLPLAGRNKKGEHQFKMSQMARYGKDVRPFYNTIMKHVQASVSCIVNKRELKEQIDNLGCSVTDPRWGEVEIDLDGYVKLWRRPFYFAFRGLMDAFHRERIDNPDLLPLDGVVDFIFDNDANEAIVRAVWDEYVSRRREGYRAAYGRKPEFEDDEEFPPLQAADFRAWWVRKWANEFGPERIFEGTYPFETGDRVIRHLVLTVSAEQIQKSVAEAVGAALQEQVARGAPLSPKEPSSIRYWPRKSPFG